MSAMKQAGLFIVLCAVVSAAASANVERDFSRYRVILERRPFGAVEEPEPVEVAPTPVAPPAFIQNLRLCAITEDTRGIKVGIVDAKQKPPRSYYLSIGEKEEGIELVEADYEEEAALVRSGGQEYWLYMGEQPVISSTASAPLGLASRPAQADNQPVKRESYAERLRKRREAMAKRLTAPPKLTGEDLEKHLQEYQMDLIREGKPPLPIPLTKEMDDKLVEEGVLPPAP